MASEWHKKYSECEDNITIKSKDKTKGETNISQLRINKKKKDTVANNVNMSYFNTPNYSSWSI
jgi:hypothetical protein